jgi:hypothetical protein
MAGKFRGSMQFLSAGMLLGIVSLVALPLIAKEKVHKFEHYKEPHGFLVDKKELSPSITCFP